MITKDYDRKLVEDKMNALSIVRDGGEVVTKYHGIVINEAELSDRYGIFQFGEFINQLLPSR